MNIKQNCIYYSGDIPCAHHKVDRRNCDNCAEYCPIMNKILIIKLGAVGDVLRTTSIIPALNRKYPQSFITWITRKSAYPLLKPIELVHRVLNVEENYLELILNERFDLGICLDADPLSGSIHNLANCGTKKGFVTNEFGKAIPVNPEAEEWWKMGIDDNLKRKNRRTYQEIIYHICGIDGQIHKPIIAEKIINRELIARFKNKHKLAANKYQIIGINTGGGSRWQWKKWTKGNYLKLIQQIKQFWHNIPIILYGGPDEIEFNSQIMEEVGVNNLIDAGCNNSLPEFISLVNISDIFITPDSLGLHIATGLNKTTIVLVGPTSPWELDVYGNGDIIYSDMDCIACYLNRCDKKPNCMENISPDIVLEKIKKYL